MKTVVTCKHQSVAQENFVITFPANLLLIPATTVTVHTHPRKSTCTRPVPAIVLSVRPRNTPNIRRDASHLLLYLQSAEQSVHLTKQFSDERTPSEFPSHSIPLPQHYHRNFPLPATPAVLMFLMFPQAGTLALLYNTLHCIVLCSIVADVYTVLRSCQKCQWFVNVLLCCILTC